MRRFSFGGMMPDLLCDRTEKFCSLGAKAISITTTGIGLLTLNDIAAIVGIICSIGAFWYSARQQNKRTRLIAQLASQKLDCAVCQKVQSND